jgi:hypothetical protein
VLSVALLTEAASIELQSGRFEERYLLVLAPLLPIAFLLWQRMRYPLRSVAAGVAVVILLVLPFVPLSTYALRFGASASPFLGAVAYLERSMSVSRAGLVVAASASFMALLALVIALRPTRTAIGVALGAGLVWLVAVSAGSTSLANHNSEVIRAHSPADLSWVDRLGVRDAVLVSTFGSRPYEGTLTLFWNPRAFGEASTLGRGLALDAFGTSRLRIARDGRLLLDRRVLGRPFLLDREGTLVRLSGATRVASVGGFTLWRPAGAPRVRLLAEGFYADGRLAQSADVQLWPDAGGSLAGTLRLTFEGLPTMPAQHLTLSAPGLHRTLDLRPGERKQVALAVRADGPYALRIVARNATGYNGGPLTAGLAATPVFVPAR